MGSSWTRAQTRVPCIGRRVLNHCATREVPGGIFKTLPTFLRGRRLHSRRAPLASPPGGFLGLHFPDSTWQFPSAPGNPRGSQNVKGEGTRRSVAQAGWYPRLCPSPGRAAPDVPEEDRVRSLPRYGPALAGPGGFSAAGRCLPRLVKTRSPLPAPSPGSVAGAVASCLEERDRHRLVSRRAFLLGTGLKPGTEKAGGCLWFKIASAWQPPERLPPKILAETHQKQRKIPESQERWAAWEEPLPALRQTELPRLPPEAEASQRKGKPPSPQPEEVRQLPLSHAGSALGAETVLLSAPLAAPSPGISACIWRKPPSGATSTGQAGERETRELWPLAVQRGPWAQPGVGSPGTWTPLWVYTDSVFRVSAAQAVEVGRDVPSQGQSHISSVSRVVWSPGWAAYKPEPERWTQLLSREAAVGQGQDSG